jgi:hypothetical protein
MTTGQRDIVISVLLIVASALLYRETHSIPRPRFEPLGSAFFPRVILISIIILAFGLIAQTLLHSYKKKQGVMIQTVKDGSNSDFRYVIVAIVIFAIYILFVSLSLVNFHILTFTFLFLLTFFFGFCRIRALFAGLAVATIFTSCIYFFGKLLNLILP